MPISKYFKGHGEEVMASIRKAHPDYSEERVRQEFYATANKQHANPGESMAKPKLGTGERFRLLKASLAGKRNVFDPGALAAWIGRRKYGKKKFQQLSAAGRRG